MSTSMRVFWRILAAFAIALAIVAARAHDQPASADSVPAAATTPGRSDVLFITLQEAQARASAASKAAELANLNVTAARYHRQAAQADYFPKIGSTFANLHFNKFMGQELSVRNRTVGLPLLSKDQSLVAVTVTQPVTPLFKVNQAVRLARADERIAQAKADAAAAAVAGAVQSGYFALLIAQRQQVAAEATVKMLESPIQLASAAMPHMTGGLVERQSALPEAERELITTNTRVAELSQSLNLLMGLPGDTALDLAAPPPLEEADFAPQAPEAAIERNPEVVEAREGVEKTRAGARLAKLDYIPDVAGLWGYAYQTAVPLLPRDFSFVGFVVSWNVFDFGKRERTISERDTQIRMAEANLDLVRAKVAASVQKASLDLQRTRRILQLTRQVASLRQAIPASFMENDPGDVAERASAEADMFQAELDFRLAYAELKRALGDNSAR